MARFGLQFTRDERFGTRRSSSSPREPLSGCPFSQDFSFLRFIPRAKELSVRADCNIQPRRKIYIQSFSTIRVLSIGKREPPLIDKLSFGLSIIKTGGHGNPNSVANTRKASIMAFSGLWIQFAAPAWVY